MNKGFANYFKGGFSAAHGTIKRSKINLFKYYLLNICIILAKIGVITYPLARLISVRTAKMIGKEERIDVYNAFSSTDRPKSYIEAFFYMIVEGLILVAGIIMFALVSGLFTLLCLSITSGDMLIILLIIFNAPVAIGLIIFIVLFILYFRPGWYIMDSNPQMRNTAIIYNSNQAMKHGGKATAFAIDFAHYLIDGIILALLVGIPLVLLFSVDVSVGSVVAIICGLIIIFVLPFFRMAHHASLALFYDDIKLVYPSEEYESSIQDKKVVKGKGHLKLKAQNKESVLLSLFDTEVVQLKEEAHEDTTAYNLPENDYADTSDYDEENPKDLDITTENTPNEDNSQAVEESNDEE